MGKRFRPVLEVRTNGVVTHNMAQPPEPFLFTLHGETANTRIPVEVEMDETQVRNMLQHIVERYAVGADIWDWERVNGPISKERKPTADRYAELCENVRNFVRWYYCQEDDPEEILASLGDMLAALIGEDPAKLWETREEGRNFYDT